MSITSPVSSSGGNVGQGMTYAPEGAIVMGLEMGMPGLTFDSRDIDIHQLHNEMVMVPGWADYYSDDMLALSGFFSSGGM